MNKNINRHSQKRMANKLMKRCSLVISEKQIKNIVQHFAPTILENAQNFHFQLTFHWWKCQLIQSSLWKTIWRYLVKLKFTNPKIQQCRSLLHTVEQFSLKCGPWKCLMLRNFLQQFNIARTFTCMINKLVWMQGVTRGLSCVPLMLSRAIPETWKQQSWSFRYFQKHFPRETLAYLCQETCTRMFTAACLKRRN